jgi:photosystem II stability/assembly factor-like uncharacterized protein
MRKYISLFLCFITTFSIAQTGSTQQSITTITTSDSFSPDLYGGMKWRGIGPYRGGRSGTVTGVKNNPLLYYFGSVGSGVWKTEDGGQTWDNITDKYFGGTVGAIAVSQSNTNVIYAGEGEQTVRNNVSSGWGMWKSEDTGKTWKHIGLMDSRHIGRIRIHPTNPDLVYVAVMGDLWKPSETRGVYRSKDGGKTWEKVLFASNEAGAVDLTLDPNNPDIIYASTWNIKRNGWRMDSGGPDSKLWKSVDGGNTWKSLSANPGMPAGTIGIIGVSVSASNSMRVYASIEAKEGGVFRSDDAGETWTRVNQDRALLQRAWYYCRIIADPVDSNTVYVMNVSYGKSTDGGKTFKLYNAPHGDHHDLWIDPNDNKRMIIGDDGGAQISYNGGKIWTTYHNQPTAQIYRVTTDDHFPYRIYGAQQDNTSIRISHRSSETTITEKDWDEVDLGESAHLAPDPTNNDIVYGSAYKGTMKMQDMVTGQLRSTNVWPDLPAGSGADIMKYRMNWNYPLVFSHHDPKKLYAGSNYLHVSYNGGQSWDVISPDLSRNEPATIKSSGGPITQDNTGAEYYANIFVITESPYTKDEIWVGSDDGLLHVTQNGGKVWKNITPPTSPKYNMMNAIDVNPFVKGGAYVVATSYKFGDFKPYIYRTYDYGKTWKVITNGIPETEYARVVRADPKRKGLLYAGTEKGMWISFDDGESWRKFQLNLPPVAIHDLAIKDNNLIAATHGRSFWLIDDLTPLHQLTPEASSKAMYLFQPKPSYRFYVRRDSDGLGGDDLKLAGENHPDGVIINYYVKDISDSGEVKLQILEQNGTLIKSYSNKDTVPANKLKLKSGGNNFVWDMRYPGYKTFPGMVFYGSPNLGPKAVPGKYKVRLVAKGDTMVHDFEILKDPRVKTPLEDFKAQFDFLMAVRDKVTEANQAIIDIRKVKDNITALKKSGGSQEKIKKLEDQLLAIEKNIHQTNNRSVQDALNFGIKVNNRLAFLMVDQGTADARPTKQAEEVRVELTKEVDKELKSLKTILDANPALLRPKRAF